MMLDVYRTLLRACEKDGGVLVTVVKASGSSPRGTGACMAVGTHGLLAGTIGGGSLENEAVGEAIAHFEEKRNAKASFDLGNAKSGLGMVCGGDVEILFTYLPPQEKTLAALGLVVACLENHASGRLILPFDAGIGFLNARHEIVGLSEEAPVQELESARGVVTVDGRTYYVEPLSVPPAVFILGGGHIAQALSRLLPDLDFPYRLVDDRTEYADPRRFSEALSVHHLLYLPKELDKLPVKPGDFIVIVTEGHAGDYEAEKWALSTPAAYIGVVGSQAKTEKVRAMLKADGFTESELDRVMAPIGIPIGSDTPAEIAISIAAQLIQHRAALRKMS